MRLKKTALLLILVVVIPLATSVRNVESKARASDIYVVGNYAYILMYDDVGLYISDLSDKSNPKFVSFLKLDAYSCNELFVDGDYAYISVQSEISSAKFEVYIVDISTPEEPVHVGSYLYSTDYFSNDLFVSGDVLYIVVQYVLKIVSVANHESPVLLKEEMSWTIYGVHVQGNTAFVTDGGGIKALDVSTPSSPVLISEFNDVEGYGIEVEGSYAFLHSSSEIFRVNIANPAAMFNSRNYSIGYLDQFCVLGDFLYALKSSTLYTIDFSIILPDEIDYYYTGEYYYKMCGRDNHIYLTSYDLQILDVTNPESPSLVSQSKITLPGVLIRNIILGVIALLIVLSSIGVIVWKRDQIKERMEQRKAQQLATQPGATHRPGKMHRAVRISIISSVAFFVASLAVIIGVQSWDFGTGIPICLSLGPISIAALCLAPLITWGVVKARKKPMVIASPVSAEPQTELPKEKQEGMIFCPSCGKEISAEYKHCPKCDHKIE